MRGVAQFVLRLTPHGTSKVYHNDHNLLVNQVYSLKCPPKEHFNIPKKECLHDRTVSFHHRFLTWYFQCVLQWSHLPVNQPTHRLIHIKTVLNRLLNIPKNNSTSKEQFNIPKNNSISQRTLRHPKKDCLHGRRVSFHHRFLTWYFQGVLQRSHLPGQLNAHTPGLFT